MEYKPFTTKQKNVISAITAIVTSWATSNDISSPTMRSDIWEELRKLDNVDTLDLVEVAAIDSWDSFRYQIAFEDQMCPFFEPEYDKFNEFKTYEAALEAGIYSALKLMK